MNDAMIKVLIKVLNEDKDELQWAHLCYVPKDLYHKYLTMRCLDRFEFADCVSEWARQDFNVELPMTTRKDIFILKELVIDKYKRVYPQIISYCNVGEKKDNMGWIRVWCSYHMEKDLQKLLV